MWGSAVAWAEEDGPGDSGEEESLELLEAAGDEADAASGGVVPDDPGDDSWAAMTLLGTDVSLEASSLAGRPLGAPVDWEAEVVALVDGLSDSTEATASTVLRACGGAASAIQ